MRIDASFWPCAKEYHACRDFKKLTTLQKVITLAVALFAAFASFFVLGLGAVATFRHMVAQFIVKKTEKVKPQPLSQVLIEKPKVEKLPTPSIVIEAEPKPVLQIVEKEVYISPAKKYKPQLVGKRKSEVGTQGFKKFEAMEEAELASHVKSLEGEELTDFWRFENQAAGSYREKEEFAKMRMRLKVEFEALSLKQFTASLPLRFFWDLLGNMYFKDVIASTLNVEQWGCMAAWFKKQKVENPDNPYYDFVAMQATLNQLVGGIPQGEEYSEKMEAICPHVTVELERVIQGKISPIKGTKRAMLRRLTGKAVKEDLARPLTPSPTRKPSQNPRRRSWAVPDKKAPPPFPLEPDRYKREMSDEGCQLYVQGWSEEKQESNEDAFFWVLDNVETMGEKKAQAFVRHFTLRTNNLDDYRRLEKLSAEQLATFVKLLEGKSLIRFFEVEKYAGVSVYKEKRELNRMQQRLKIELESLSNLQLQQLLPIKDFWTLIQDNEYAAAAAIALTEEHFRDMACWLQQHSHEEFRSVFNKAIRLLPGETGEEKIQLGKKLKAIIPYASEEMKNVIRSKLLQASKADRVILNDQLNPKSPSAHH